MANSSPFSKIHDALQDQVWFQELKTKWEDLDPQTRGSVKMGSGIACLLLVGWILTSALWSVKKLQHELNEKTELMSMIQSGTDELRRLREQSPTSVTPGEFGPANVYFETVAQSAGIDPTKVAVSGERPGTSTDQAKEALIDVSLKKVNLKQLVKYAVQVESGDKPVKLRHLTIDTQAELDGYLDATLAVSTFSLKSN